MESPEKKKQASEYTPYEDCLSLLDAWNDAAENRDGAYATRSSGLVKTNPEAEADPGHGIGAWLILDMGRHWLERLPATEDTSEHIRPDT